MLKVVVFDSGYGGDMVADFLEEELAILDVERVIDWKNLPYGEKSRAEVRKLIKAQLAGYFNRVDLIVLAGYEAAVEIDYFRRQYPDQKFVAMSFDLKNNYKTKENILVLAGHKLKRSDEYQRMMKELRGCNVIAPRCGHWTQMIDDGTMTKARLEKELGRYADRKIDAVVILNTHFWDIKKEIEDILGWTMIEDFREMLLGEVKIALKLRGAHYRRTWSTWGVA